MNSLRVISARSLPSIGTALCIRFVWQNYVTSMLMLSYWSLEEEPDWCFRFVLFHDSRLVVAQPSSRALTNTISHLPAKESLSRPTTAAECYTWTQVATALVASIL